MIISDTVVDRMLVAAVAMESRRCNAVFLDAAAKTEQLTLLRIDLAVAAEREACAMIAETHSGAPIGGCDGADCGFTIAAKIRVRPE